MAVLEAGTCRGDDRHGRAPRPARDSDFAAGTIGCLHANDSSRTAPDRDFTYGRVTTAIR